ncbi:AIPR family protein [Streptomyces sp. NPDC059863]|uniref:AIPR family protein n=1 Tax=unclassified Streptomyces TaxID=2593676 RepID=UPI0036469E80
MTAPRRSNPDVPTQVHQVGTAFDAMYTSLLDMSDWASFSEDSQASARRSRALAAHAVRIVTGWSPADAAATVIDGGNDQGIDAIAVVDTPEQEHIYLVQAKWSPRGTARAKTDAIHKLLAGLRLIDSEEFGQFNPRGRQLAEEAKNVMGRGVVPVTQVIVLMGTDQLSDEANQAIANGEQEFNQHGAILSHRVILAREIYDKVRDDIAVRPVDLRVDLHPWLSIADPYESYQGVMLAEEVAAWATHGNDLFNSNIRNPLGLTPINNELLTTLGEEPGYFWYFNNGITVLCDSVTKTQQSMLSPHSRPLSLRINGASVVNGAQTVRAIADALSKDGTAAGVAKVGVRIIVTGGEKDFAQRTTHATNRQNSMVARDYIALDAVQAALIEEMRAELDLEYSVRRSELEPLEESGCSVVEAATALACAHPNSQYAARIASSLDVLWERGSQGIYDILFRPQPSVYLLWNAVCVLRSVRKGLDALRKGYEGRGAAVVDHGTFLIAHLIFRQLADEAMDEVDRDQSWVTQAIARVPELLQRTVPALVTTMDDLYGDRSQVKVVCADTLRCRDLTDEVLHRLAIGVAPSLPERYKRSDTKRRKPRRPNSVHVIVDQSALDDGTPLSLYTFIQPEREALSAWLNEDPRRSRATWANHRTKPILWAVDGKQYSPSGLIAHMWELAGWEGRPVSNQGTARWTTPDGETLVELALRLLEELESEDGEEA